MCIRQLQRRRLLYGGVEHWEDRMRSVLQRPPALSTAAVAATVAAAAFAAALAAAAFAAALAAAALATALAPSVAATALAAALAAHATATDPEVRVFWRREHKHDAW
jgi:hypothetical protein